MTQRELNVRRATMALEEMPERKPVSPEHRQIEFLVDDIHAVTCDPSNGVEPPHAAEMRHVREYR